MKNNLIKRIDYSEAKIKPENENKLSLGR